MDYTLTFKDHESELIKACIAKERWAQRKLYEEYYGLMMGVCLRYSTNSEDARDILHDAFIKVFFNIHKYKPGTSLKSWIKRIVVNTAIDQYRKMQRRRSEDLDTVSGVMTKGPDAMDMYAEKELLQSIQQLTPAYRSVFNLYIIEGYAHKEVAKLLNITESTSRSNLVKARSKLREILNNMGMRNE